MAEPDALRVLIADDHPVVRRGLRALLASLPGVTVVGEVADGEAAVREAQIERPDVVLMDVRMPGVDGLEATRRIRDAVPSIAVLVLTMDADDATVRAALSAGARGYLLKESEQDDVLAALRSVAAGHLVLGDELAGRLSEILTDTPAAAPPVPFPDLTEREREVLDLLAAGRSTSAIADALCLSTKTVSNHLTHVFTKLGVSNRTAAVLAAREAGLGAGVRP